MGNNVTTVLSLYNNTLVYLSIDHANNLNHKMPLVWHQAVELLI